MNTDDLVSDKLSDIAHEAALCRDIVGQGYETFMELSREGKALRRMAERAVENISEATRALPEEWKSERRFVPWREISDTRNKITHAYDEIDYEIIWQVIEARVPQLADQLDLPRDLDPYSRF